MWQRSVDELVEGWKKNPDTELRLERLLLEELPKELLEIEVPIKRLSLAINSLSTLPVEFAQSHNEIIELELMGNEFHKSEDNTELYKTISLFSDLEKLSISENRLSDPFEFIKTLLEMKKITTLLAFSFPMGVHVGQCLSLLSQVTTLTRLDLGVCNIHGFPTELNTLNNLTFLDVSFNHFTTIPSEIGNLTNLSQLVLSGCSITHIGEGITKLENLELLRLDLNELRHLPKNMSNMSKLASLSLTHNNFTEIPSCLVDTANGIVKLPSLTSVQLQGNLLRYEGTEPLPFDNISIQVRSSQHMQRPSLVIESEEISNEMRKPVLLHGVYLGDYGSAKNKHLLEEFNVKSVLVVGNRLCQIYPLRFKYLQYEIDDDEGELLEDFFIEGTEFIRRERERGCVLVHCAAGISRSASLVIAYLIRYNKLAYDDAFELVKSRRNFINPNKSFVEQLKKFEILYRAKGLFARLGLINRNNK